MNTWSQWCLYDNVDVTYEISFHCHNDSIIRRSSFNEINTVNFRNLFEKKFNARIKLQTSITSKA